MYVTHKARRDKGKHKRTVIIKNIFYSKRYRLIINVISVNIPKVVLNLKFHLISLKNKTSRF